ncbi:MAG TPA: sugar transferase [Pirellulaceae bacterium]|nr:sugar transferase [Planctomycetales bacterium]MCB9938257.1 sugar transferase [Planctomycetaceae bacterium]HRX79863.1 sugar transferase [Pirellulaceae bacterium]
MFLIRMFQKPRKVDHLLSDDRFHEAIDHERMRVDRNGSRFSLVVFDCSEGDHDTLNRQLSEICHKRLRTIDRAGLLASGDVGVLLPETDAVGAQKVASDIKSSLQQDCDSLGLKIYGYPDIANCECQNTSAQAAPAAVYSADELLVEPLPLWKRMLDVVGSTVGLLVATPVMIVAAIAIKLDSPGPVLFKQVRAGLGGRPFNIYKFRTMTVGAEEQKHALRANSEQDGPAFKIKNDPRVTRVGRYLRRTCIDEFPQFLNVLKGDMSLVGPRPLPCEESEECEDWQRRRLSVTPGLTCIWQVSGGMKIPFVEWMRMDIRYIRSRRLLHDLKLLWATLLAVVFHRASH